MADTQGQQQGAEPKPGTPEYNAKMAAAYDNQGKTQPNSQDFTPPKPQRPAEVPEKFWDAEKGVVNYEAWSKSYKELESKFTQSNQNKDAADKSGDPDAAAKDAAQNAGLNWETLQQKVVQGGKLDDSDYAALEKSGVPKAIVDDYLGLLASNRQAAQERTATYVGGKDKLDAIMAKAATELTKEEIAVFNQQLAGEKTWKAAMDVLKQRFAPDDGEPNGQLMGDGSSTGAVTPFATAFEQTEAINKRDENGRRLYDVDPAYRARVRARMMATR